MKALFNKKLWLICLSCALIYLTGFISSPQASLAKAIYQKDSLSSKNLFAITGFSDRQIDSLKNTTKIYYVSFWASWCAPCIGNFKFSKRLQEEYKSKPVTFLYISLDEDATAWQNASLKYNLSSSKNFRIANLIGNPFIENYQITSIPRYMVFDKNGEVISSKAPNPSNPAIREVLDDLLQK